MFAVRFFALLSLWDLFPMRAVSLETQGIFLHNCDEKTYVIWSLDLHKSKDRQIVLILDASSYLFDISWLHCYAKLSWLVSIRLSDLEKKVTSALRINTAPSFIQTQTYPTPFAKLYAISERVEIIQAYSFCNNFMTRSFHPYSTLRFWLASERQCQSYIAC